MSLVISRLATKNKLFDTIVGGRIAEYDIRSAGSTAIREIKGEATYEYLMKLDKLPRNVTIGKMMRSEEGLAQKVNQKMLDYLNLFIVENDIKNSNFVYNTRDSIVLYNKIPMKTTFGNVEFRNKDGEFSSMFDIGRLTIFFDSMSHNMMCKGVNDDIVNSSPFLEKFLKFHLMRIEMNQKSGSKRLLYTLTNMRNSYLNNTDNSIYRDLLNDNLLPVTLDDQVMYLDSDIEGKDSEFEIMKKINYVNVVLPISRSALLNG